MERGGKFLYEFARREAIKNSSEVFGVPGAYCYAMGTRYTPAFIKSAGIFRIDGLCRTLLGTQSATGTGASGFRFQRNVSGFPIGIVSRNRK